MDKVSIDRNAAIPMPVCIVGTVVNEKANFMPVGWVCRTNYQPPMIGIGIGKNHLTSKGVKQNGTFSVNFPGRPLMAKTDCIGLFSGSEKDKSTLFDCFYGEVKTAPLISEAPFCLACRVVEAVDLPTNIFFIGEIIEAWSETRYLSKEHPDIKRMDVFFLSMPDNRYWALGETIGTAWNRENLKILVDS
ncbi:MAG: flavin reductase family protein [Deltaproteobacteria bacterium]|nr:flavin reductase family protein [Deltaproteobacteria bacterium]